MAPMMCEAWAGHERALWRKEEMGQGKEDVPEETHL
jgi:hypothetical protein